MKKQFLFLLYFFFAIPLFAQDNMLTTEKLWQLKRLSEPMPSPDGKWVIYGAKSYDIALNKGNNIIYLQNLTDGKMSKLTNEKQNAFSAKWSTDGLSVTFLSNTNDGAQLFKVDINNNSNAQQLTHIKGGIGAYKFSPDGKHLAFTAQVKLDKTTQEIYQDLDKTSGRVIDGLLYRHWDAWHDGTYSHLFLAPVNNGIPGENAIDLLLGERYDCPLKPHGGDDDFTWSPDGSKIAYVCKKETGTTAAFSTNSDVYVYRLKDKDLLNISRKNKGYDKQPEFSPDGKQLLWLSMTTPGYESDKSNIKVYVFDGINAGNKDGIKAQVEPVKTLTAQFDYTIEHASWIDNQKIAFIAVKDASKNIFIYNPKNTSNNGISALSNGLQDFNSLAILNGKNKGLLALQTKIDQPAELVKIDLITGKQSQLTSLNKDLLSGIQFGKVEKRLIPATDGKNILTWVIYPPNFDPKKSYPTLLYCQGGPQSPVSQGFSYRWNFQLMAAHGYIVIAPNRRGLPGFGSEWNDAITGDYGGQCMRDYLSAIDAVSKEPFVNREKLGAVGASFGGFSVYWLAGNHQNRFKAFIAHCGMFNMESWYGSTEEMFFAQHDNNGPYWYQNKPSNFDASPHRFVQNWNTPILVIHNEKDYRVPVTQGMEAFTAAQSMQIPSKFLYFPDENHWVTKPQNSVLWQRVFFEWLDQWLKAPASK
jgi:dipeptidyl aminopeptidase/acylaminoacyl peptidase